MLITVRAKQSGLHPVTGLHLEAGEIYTIDEKHFSAEVFDRAAEDEGGEE